MSVFLLTLANIFFLVKPFFTLLLYSVPQPPKDASQEDEHLPFIDQHCALFCSLEAQNLSPQDYEKKAQHAMPPPSAGDRLQTSAGMRLLLHSALRS